MTVSLSIVSNDEVPPNLVDEEGGADNVGIVSLMVVGNPDSNESPEGLDSWVSTESGSLLWLSSYSNEKKKFIVNSIILFCTSILIISWTTT